jgi:hypothetical protein
MEINYPHQKCHLPTAFQPNEDLVIYLTNLYWETIQLKVNLTYTPDTHIEYQHSISHLQGKLEGIQEILNNFQNS